MLTQIQTAHAKLPEQAAAKFALFRRLADEAESLARLAKERREEIEGLARIGKPVSEVAPRVTDLSDAQHAHQERHRLFSALVTSINGWLGQLPATASIESVKVAVPKASKGETPAEQLIRVREEIMHLDAELAKVMVAPLPRADAKAHIRKFVSNLAEQGKPSIRLGAEMVIGFDNGLTFDSTASRRVLALLAWHDPDAMVARLDAELEKIPETKAALSAAERADRIAGLKRQIEQAERTEEAIIETAEKNGINLDRRVTASVVSILGVRVVSRGSLRAVA